MYVKDQRALDIIKECREKVYSRIQDIQTQLIDDLNKNLKGKKYKYMAKPPKLDAKYVHVCCSTPKCKFCHWYIIDRLPNGEPTNIKWFRVINSSHTNHPL